MVSILLSIIKVSDTSVSQVTVRQDLKYHIKRGLKNKNPKYTFLFWEKSINLSGTLRDQLIWHFT